MRTFGTTAADKPEALSSSIRRRRPLWTMHPIESPVSRQVTLYETGIGPPKPDAQADALFRGRYSGRFGTPAKKSASCCFQNRAMAVVP